MALLILHMGNQIPSQLTEVRKQRAKKGSLG